MKVSPTRQRLLGNPVSRTILSIWGWLMIGVVVIVFVPLTFIVFVTTAPFDRGRYWAGFTFRRLCVVHTWLNPLWSFRTSGLEITDPRRPYVVVANHESFADMLLISHLPWEMKWLAKEAWFKYPLVGWLMMMAGDVKIIRGNKQSIVEAMKDCHDRLDKKVSVMLFPEGTRSRSGEMGEFKDGAFRLAIETGCPILPMVVAGTREAMNPGDWRWNVTSAEVRVLQPIETTGLTRADVGELRDRVRAIIVDELATMKD
ncbi:MAG: lysophospholipid acyltransferase family protein [Ilumatobacteraceae bacterium]